MYEILYFTSSLAIHSWTDSNAVPWTHPFSKAWVWLTLLVFWLDKNRRQNADMISLPSSLGILFMDRIKGLILRSCRKLNSTCRSRYWSCIADAAMHKSQYTSWTTFYLVYCGSCTAAAKFVLWLVHCGSRNARAAALHNRLYVTTLPIIMSGDLTGLCLYIPPRVLRHLGHCVSRSRRQCAAILALLYGPYFSLIVITLGREISTNREGALPLVQLSNGICI